MTMLIIYRKVSFTYGDERSLPKGREITRAFPINDVWISLIVL